MLHVPPLAERRLHLNVGMILRTVLVTDAPVEGFRSRKDSNYCCLLDGLSTRRAPTSDSRCVS